MFFFIVRHGETEDNKKNICQGQREGKLSKQGKLQASLLGKALAHEKIDLCYTSDLCRALETTKLILAQGSEIEVLKDSRLRERNFGPLQGQVMPSHWDGLAPIEGGEKLADIYQRCLSFVQEISYLHKDKKILIVSHGVTMQVLTSVCLGYKLSQVKDITLPKNCSISKLKKTAQASFKLVEFNNTSHLTHS